MVGLPKAALNLSTVWDKTTSSSSLFYVLLTVREKSPDSFARLGFFYLNSMSPESRVTV